MTTSVSNAQIFAWYSDKNKDCLTKKCMPLFSTSSDGYVQMANDFLGLSFADNSKKQLDNESLYKSLHAWEEYCDNNGNIDYDKDIKVYNKYENEVDKYHYIIKASQLNKRLQPIMAYIDKDMRKSILHPALDDDGHPSQQWHLLVSVLLYRLICHIYRGKYYWKSDFWNNGFDTITQYIPLKVWMIENAPSRIIKTDKFNELKENIKSGEVDKDTLKRKINDLFNDLVNNWNNPTYILPLKFFKKSQMPDFLLKIKIARREKALEVYKKADSSRFDEIYGPRSSFDKSNNVIYDLFKSIPCDFGDDGPVRTPSGIFDVKKVSDKEFNSGYQSDGNQFKSFGYLEIFGDFVIHSSDMYEENETKKTFKETTPVTPKDIHIRNSIRVKQAEFEWLINELSENTVIEM